MSDLRKQSQASITELSKLADYCSMMSCKTGESKYMTAYHEVADAMVSIKEFIKSEEENL